MILAVMNAIYAIAYIVPEKDRTLTGFEPVTSRHRCDGHSVRHFNTDNWDQSGAVKYDKVWISEKMIISKQFKV